jgi:hypothetical protein
MARLMVGVGRKVNAEIAHLRDVRGVAPEDEAVPVLMNPSWDEILRVTDVRLHEARSALAIELLADPVLAAMVPAVRAVLGDRLRATILFGSRARGEARPDSDYDLLFLVNVEDTKPVHEEVTPACPAPISHELCGVREAWDSLIHDGDVTLLNMLTEGVVLDGDVPWILLAATSLTIELFRLRRAPAISKGAWVASWDLPPKLPLLWLQCGEMLGTRKEGDRVVPVTEEEGVDQLLRALVTVRVRGDLTLPRARLLELAEEHVLAGVEARTVRGHLDDRPRLAREVRGILSERYREWSEDVLWRLDAGRNEP